MLVVEMDERLSVCNVKHFLNGGREVSSQANCKDQRWIVAPCLNGIDGLARNSQGLTK
jgi:hypothetical protein